MERCFARLRTRQVRRAEALSARSIPGGISLPTEFKVRCDLITVSMNAIKMLPNKNVHSCLRSLAARPK